MEPLTILMAIAGLVTSGALTKVGENTLDSFPTFIVKSKQLLDEIQKKSSSTAIAIKNAKQKPLDYDKAYMDVEAISKNDLDIQNLLKEVQELIKANQKIDEMVKRELNKSSSRIVASIENSKGINTIGNNNTISGNIFNYT